MKSYFSLMVLGLFVPAVVALYQLAPRRARPLVLLAASYAFFWSISGKLLAFLLFSTLSVWATGLVLEELQRRRAAEMRGPDADRRAVKRRFARYMRAAVAACVVANLGVLAALKYLAFFETVAAPLLAPLGIEVPQGGLRLGVPIGISFYTLSAVSYVVDVYRKTSPADHNPVRLALFLAFFPQIMEGPIARYNETACSLWSGRPVTAENLFGGTARVLWGLAKKLIVADRVNVFVKTVFDGSASVDGGMVALAAVLYTIQLYCDFSGTMDFAVGVGRIFGTRLPENFRQPFASRTASEFWQRWHVTLGAWFRDYVFYPVSLSKPVKRLTNGARHLLGNRMGPLAASGVALACVWFGNGLWHGAGGQYLLFGAYYFVLIWLGGLMAPLAERLCPRLGIDHDGAAWHAWQRGRTLVVIFVGELIFRASSAPAALGLLGTLAGGFSLASFADGTVFSMGMDAADFGVVACAVAVLAVVGRLRERGAHPVRRAWELPVPARAAAMVALAFVIVIFGAYGGSYVPVDPMYAQF